MQSPKPYKDLTVKQAKFVKKAVEYGNMTQAAIEAYKSKSRRNASGIAKINMQKPHIRVAYEQLLEDAGLTDSTIAGAWKEALEIGKGEKATHKDWLQSLTTVTKMKGWLNDKSAHLRLNISEQVKDIKYDDLVKKMHQVKTMKAQIVP